MADHINLAVACVSIIALPHMDNKLLGLITVAAGALPGWWFNPLRVASAVKSAAGGLSSPSGSRKNTVSDAPSHDDEAESSTSFQDDETKSSLISHDEATSTVKDVTGSEAESSTSSHSDTTSAFEYLTHSETESTTYSHADKIDSLEQPFNNSPTATESTPDGETDPPTVYYEHYTTTNSTETAEPPETIELSEATESTGSPSLHATAPEGWGSWLRKKISSEPALGDLPSSLDTETGTSTDKHDTNTPGLSFLSEDSTSVTSDTQVLPSTPSDSLTALPDYDVSDPLPPPASLPASQTDFPVQPVGICSLVLNLVLVMFLVHYLRQLKKPNTSLSRDQKTQTEPQPEPQPEPQMDSQPEPAKMNFSMTMTVFEYEPLEPEPIPSQMLMITEVSTEPKNEPLNLPNPMTVETAPVSPKSAPLKLLGIKPVDTVPVELTPAVLDISDIQQQATNPKDTEGAVLSHSGVMTAETTPREARPALLKLSAITQANSVPSEPKSDLLKSSTVATQATAPIEREPVCLKLSNITRVGAVPSVAESESSSPTHAPLEHSGNSLQAGNMPLNTKHPDILELATISTEVIEPKHPSLTDAETQYSAITPGRDAMIQTDSAEPKQSSMKDSGTQYSTVTPGTEAIVQTDPVEHKGSDIVKRTLTYNPRPGEPSYSRLTPRLVDDLQLHAWPFAPRLPAPEDLPTPKDFERPKPEKKAVTPSERLAFLKKGTGSMEKQKQANWEYNTQRLEAEARQDYEESLFGPGPASIADRRISRLFVPGKKRESLEEKEARNQEKRRRKNQRNKDNQKEKKKNKQHGQGEGQASSEQVGPRGTANEAPIPVHKPQLDSFNIKHFDQLNLAYEVILPEKSTDKRDILPKEQNKLVQMLPAEATGTNEGGSQEDDQRIREGGEEEDSGDE